MEKNQLRVKVIKSLANENRLQIIDILSTEGETCVNDIVAKLGLNQSTVSKHLSVLSDAGIVRADKKGLQMFYSLRTQCVGNFLSCVDQIIREDLAKRIKPWELK